MTFRSLSPAFGGGGRGAPGSLVVKDSDRSDSSHALVTPCPGGHRQSQQQLHRVLQPFSVLSKMTRLHASVPAAGSSSANDNRATPVQRLSAVHGSGVPRKLPPLSSPDSPEEVGEALAQLRSAASPSPEEQPHSQKKNNTEGTHRSSNCVPQDDENSDAEEERALRASMREHPHFTGVPPVNDDLWQPSEALRSLLAFEMSVGEKVAFEDFVHMGRSKATPALIINSFKHFMCSNSGLVADLRQVPLKAIEDVCRNIKPSAVLSPQHFIRQFVDPLLGRHNFLEQDALALFDFMDTDSDGELDAKDICNGVVLLRSRDGPILPILHRCIMMVAPRTRREAKLAMMTRLELLHLTSVLQHVLHDYVDHARTQTETLRAAIDREVPPVNPKGVEMAQLKAQEHDVRVLLQLERDANAEVARMLEAFALDRRGNFPYAEVREFMLRSTPIRNAISLFRVPRDPDLYASYLSEYYRSTEMDEATASREFKPLMKNKNILLCGLQTTSVKQGGLAARRQTFTNTNDTTAAVTEERCVVESREAVEHDAPEFYTFRGMLYRRSVDSAAAAYVAKGDYFIEDARGRKIRRFQ